MKILYKFLTFLNIIYFFKYHKSLIDEKSPWRIDDYVEDLIYQQYESIDVSDRIDEFLEDWKNKNPFLEV